jgi:hypothetical protein
MRPVIQCTRTSFLATPSVSWRKAIRSRLTRPSATFSSMIPTFCPIVWTFWPTVWTFWSISSTAVCVLTTFWSIVSTLTSVLTAVSICTLDQRRFCLALTSKQTKKRSLAC